MTARWLLASCAVLGLAVCCRREAAASEPVERAPSIATAEPLYRRFKVSIGFHYSSGDYGTSDTTEIIYVPLVLKLEIERWSLQATIPYLSVSGPAVVEGPNGPISNGDGLGDVLARVSYLLPRNDGWPSFVPFLEIVGLVKFPTAREGLGTDEFDFGLDGELTWTLGRVTPFATVGYRFLGDAELNDVFVGSAGAVVRIVDGVSAGLLLDYREASSSSTDERLEIVPFAAWRFLPHWSIDPYVSAGLTKGSPDAGVGVQLSYAW